MTPDSIFSLCSGLAMLSWILLIVVPYEKLISNLVFGVVITLLALVYAFIVLQAIKPGDFESFNTLDGVMGLFTKKEAVLAGWIHYLAFDLMVGLFIVNNAKKYGVNRLILIPALLFTFMLGPVGLLIYKLIKGLKVGKILSYD